MKNRRREGALPPTEEEEQSARLQSDSPQTRSPTFRLAYLDHDFILQDELRPVRLQLELLKPELIQHQLGIESTVVIFGSTRIPEPEAARERLKAAEARVRANLGNDDLLREAEIAGRIVAKSRYYDEARKLSSVISSTCQISGRCNFVVITGGGPGIMEAANRGAHDVGAKSIGLNIVLPFEQKPNEYITPELCFQFHYFAIRKMHFLMRAKALVAFPGGYGTLDELFETLTLIQTKKIDPVPVILFGKEYWERIINFDELVLEGTISPEDIELFQYVETAEEAWQRIVEVYDIKSKGEE
jgi:uncharacterized protein (TIGR00730 family)